MAHRNTGTPHSCPLCKAALTRENGVLRCEMHGTFFAYGPQLVVRVPRMNGKISDTVMPWENRKHHAR